MDSPLACRAEACYLGVRRRGDGSGEMGRAANFPISEEGLVRGEAGRGVGVVEDPLLEGEHRVGEFESGGCA